MRYFICILILILIPSAVSCGEHDGSIQSIPQNTVVINSENFYVRSDSTDLDTFTRGTVFVKKDDSDNYYVQIAAWIEIDRLDRGGVIFAFPFGWEVTSITSNYSDYRRNHNPEDYIETRHGDDYLFDELGTRITVGCSLPPGNSPSGGGAGSIVIELQKTSSELNPYPGGFETSIAVGYKETEYYNVLYSDHERIELSLPHAVPDLGIELSLDRPPIWGDILQLTCTASLEQWNGQGVSKATIDIMIPKAFELIDGDLSWSGDISGGSAVTIQATLKAVEMGEYEINANIIYSFSKYRYIRSDKIYLGIFKDRGFISDEHLDFETSKIPTAMALASSDMKSILQLETSLSESLELNTPIEVTCIATAINDVSEIEEISINWDEGFEFLEGNPLCQGGLAEGDQVVLTTTLMPVKTGRWKIYTQCSGTFHFDRGSQGSGSATGTFTYDHFSVYIFEDGGAVID